MDKNREGVIYFHMTDDEKTELTAARWEGRLQMFFNLKWHDLPVDHVMNDYSAYRPKSRDENVYHNPKDFKTYVAVEPNDVYNKCKECDLRDNGCDVRSDRQNCASVRRRDGRNIVWKKNMWIEGCDSVQIPDMFEAYPTRKLPSRRLIYDYSQSYYQCVNLAEGEADFAGYGYIQQNKFLLSPDRVKYKMPVTGVLSNTWFEGCEIVNPTWVVFLKK